MRPTPDAYRSLAQLRFPLAGKGRMVVSPAYDLDPVPTDLKAPPARIGAWKVLRRPSSAVVDLGADLRRRDSMTDRAFLHSFGPPRCGTNYTLAGNGEMVAFDDLLRIDVSLTPLQIGRDER
jgi:hypothetical protein